MTFARRVSRAVTIVASLTPWLVACEQTPAASREVGASEPSPPAASPKALGPAPESTPESVPEPTPEPAPEATPAPAPQPSSFATDTASLVAGGQPSATAEDEAWTHYRAKEYAEAQRGFALASLHEPANWKHPFNLACASAMARDEAMTRIALTEAIAREPNATRKKAAKDSDLAIYRDTAWFAAMLHAEASPVPDAGVDEAPATMVTLPPPELATAMPAGVAKPLAKAKLGKLRDALREVHGLRPTIRASLVVPTPEGELAFLVYDYNLYDECRVDSDAELCKDILEASDPQHDEMANQTTCVDQFFVRVDLAKDQVGTPQALAVACSPNQVRRLDLLDIDADGQPEVVLDTIAKTAVRGWKDSPMAYNRARELAIFRLDGTLQFELKMEADAELPFSVHTRVFVRDTNGDGHLDLIQQSLPEAYDCVDGTLDADFWPACPADEMPALATETLLYDPATDSWSK